MGYLNTFLDGLVIGIVVTAAVLALWGVYSLIDKSFLPSLQVQGRVVGKSHTSDGWRLHIDTPKGRHLRMTAPLGVYDAVHDGQQVLVDFTTRRLTRRSRLTKLH